MKELFHTKDKHEFTPLLVEIEERPTSPLGRSLLYVILAFLVVGLLWLFLAKIYIVVSARGKIVPDGEIKTGLFLNAKPGSVGLYVVARYSQDVVSSYGSYALDKGKLFTRPMGSIAKGHNQTLNPELDGEGQTSFDPGSNPFGIFVKLPKRTFYSQAERNAQGTHAVMRVFPLRSRGGAQVPDALLVLVDEDGDGDFQDYVFTLVNVKPAQ